jgi:hypothetical protein
VRRWRLLSLILLGLVAFLAISALLARVFSATNAEQAAVTALVAAEARGDARGVVARIEGCSASSACRAGVARDVIALRHPGSVRIAQYSPSSSFSLFGTEGIARVAWTAGDSKPVVQCVLVRRAGNALSGQTIELLVLSARIHSGADCPKRL